MKLSFDVKHKHQPDPFIYEDGNKLYLYVTGVNGVEAYCADDLFSVWEYKGVVTDFETGKEFWAPSVIKIDHVYYMYVSCERENAFQYMYVAESKSPLGPFKGEKCLYNYFSIDSHMVKTDKGLFLWFAKNNEEGDRIGTRIYVDKFIDPYTPENSPKEVIVPSFDQEIYEYNRNGDGRNWHTIEGPFWFQEGDWQYVMYSGGCYRNDTYHIGYSSAKTSEADLVQIEFTKHTENGKFSPVLIKNEFEEGTGHHSVIKYKGEYYAIYHGRDYCNETNKEYTEERTARICKLTVKDGIITAQRYKDHI